MDFELLLQARTSAAIVSGKDAPGGQRRKEKRRHVPLGFWGLKIYGLRGDTIWAGLTLFLLHHGFGIDTGSIGILNERMLSSHYPWGTGYGKSGLRGVNTAYRCSIR